MSDGTQTHQTNNSLPYYRPLVWRHTTGYLHEVFSGCSFDSPAERLSEGVKRGKRRSENRRRRRWGHIVAAEGKRAESGGKVSDTKNREREKKKHASPVSENGATRCWRTRLCGGEHREEAQQEGLSQGLKDISSQMHESFSVFLLCIW